MLLLCTFVQVGAHWNPTRGFLGEGPDGVVDIECDAAYASSLHIPAACFKVIGDYGKDEPLSQEVMQIFKPAEPVHQEAT